MKTNHAIRSITALSALWLTSQCAMANGSLFANAGPDISVMLGAGNNTTVQMDGSGTVDTLGRPITYTWFGSMNGGQAAGVSPSVTFSGVAGSQEVLLYVTNDLGYTDFDSMIVDTAPPVILVQAQNGSAECDGQGNLAELQAWLDSSGGAEASDNVGFAWSHTTPVWTLGTGGVCEYATVTFSATDGSGNTYATTATFSIVDTTPPALSWTEDGVAVPDGSVVLERIRDLPSVVTATGNDICSPSTTLHKRWTYTLPSGVTTVPTVVMGSNSFTVTGAAGTVVNVYAKASDAVGNMSPEEYITVIIQANSKGNVKTKGNEGLGNGPDANTPGHDNNGGNDDPQFYPGNPGARYKHTQP
jgi:hypothetical protein